MRRHIFLKPLIFLTALLLAGCGGSSSQSTDTPFDQKHKSYLHTLLKTEYLWYEHTPQDVNYSLYTTPAEMIQDLRYSPLDRWSYSQTLNSYENNSQQLTQGFGCYFKYGQIHFMRIDSPCDKAGLQRGDIIRKVNHEDVTNENYKVARENINVESILSVERAGDIIDVAITPSEYNYKSAKEKIFTKDDGTKVGHLIYNGFTSASVEELESAFTYFKENQIDELIVDLRYNRGGSLATASILLDKLAGYNNEDAIQVTLEHNDKYSQQNTSYTFENDDNSLQLERVFFITSKNSASASEMVINALKPYLDVKLIGSQTHGKPVGMTGKKYGNVIYWLINFSVVNSKNEGYYYDGLAVDCDADDNISLPRTNENENMLKEALYFIQNGSCS